MLKDFLQAIIRTIKDPGSCWNGWDSYIREMSFTAPQDFIILPMEKRRGRRSLKTALLQILPGNSLEENLEKGLFWCREAKKAGADLALFPEMWGSG